ncbi:ABC1 kinase family protein [Haematomicrobium sanguinis]|uniref:ABC1 kinase family protein n=1 Tax=Haematomicrobium sanguinis TaxID=479106 RepID=UPI00047D611D|nr:AarF/UbiB family protein [Haematomicrobium sanguinis]
MDLLFVLLSFVMGLIVAWLIAIAGRRILNAPVGWPRSLLVGIVSIYVSGGMLTFVGLAAGLVDQNASPLVDMPVLLLFAGLTIAWAFALSFASLVVLEAVIPTGSITPPWLWLKEWRSRHRRNKRYRQVTASFLRHGLARFMRQGAGGKRDLAPNRETARRLRMALEESGVTFVKLGQTLASRPDLLPQDFVEELSLLQTSAAPMPWENVSEVLTAELGDTDAIFTSINRQPLASASLGQVHEATLRDGTDVIVKVQRPGALNQVEVDLDIIARMSSWLEKKTAWGKSIGLTALAEGFSESLREELDYRVEASNARAMEQASAGTEIAIPHVFQQWTRHRVLIMTRLDGVPLSEARTTLANLDPATRAAKAEYLLSAVMDQITKSGTFHADLHPGNILISETGGLGLLDFGSIGRLDKPGRNALGMLLFAVDAGDSLRATDALIDLLGRPTDLDERALEKEIGALLTRVDTYGGSDSNTLFGQVFTLLMRHGFAVPAPVAAAFRALSSLEGALVLIDPRQDMVTLAREYGRERLREETKNFDLKDTAQEFAMTFLPLMQRLPRRLDRITDDLQNGNFALNVRAFTAPEDRSFLVGMLQQLVTVVLAGFASIGGIMLLTADSGPMITDSVRLYAFFGYCLLFVAFVLALRVLIQVISSTRSGP